MENYQKYRIRQTITIRVNSMDVPNEKVQMSILNKLKYSVRGLIQRMSGKSNRTMTIPSNSTTTIATATTSTTTTVAVSVATVATGGGGMDGVIAETHRRRSVYTRHPTTH